MTTPLRVSTPSLGATRFEDDAVAAVQKHRNLEAGAGAQARVENTIASTFVRVRLCVLRRRVVAALPNRAALASASGASRPCPKSRFSRAGICVEATICSTSESADRTSSASDFENVSGGISRSTCGSDDATYDVMRKWRVLDLRRRFCDAAARAKSASLRRHHFVLANCESAPLPRNHQRPLHFRSAVLRR